MLARQGWARALGAALLGLLAGGALAVERPEESTAEADTIASVMHGFRHSDCKLAVSHLNRGLKARYPGIYVLAGSMYEEGLCLKANWEQAERMYLRAQEVGHGAGLLRLVAGLARGHRDIGAALWWAQQAKISLPADCRLGPAARADPEAFVRALQAWPAGRPQACAYVAGVMAFLVGDAEYPRSSLAMGFSGRVELQYTPADERMDWKTLEITEHALYGVSSGDTVADRDSRKFRLQFEAALRDLGAQALKRFQRPPAVDPAWALRMVFVFDLR